MANNQTISTVIKTISAAYPRFVVEAETVKVWASFLADIPDELLMAGVTRFISSASHPFPPSIPEIRAQVTDIRREIAGVPTGFEAWNELITMPAPRTRPLMRNGEWVQPEEPIWRNEVVGVVARRLGWPNRFPSDDNEMADRAHFVKAYEAEVNKKLQTETQIPLVTEYIEREKGKRLLDVSGEINKMLSARRT